MAASCNTSSASSMREKPPSKDPIYHDRKWLAERISAFSDIVIGFSLALQATSLAGGGTSHVSIGRIAAFLASFAIIASLWWMHNRLFAGYFVATPISVLLNFVALALIVLLVYGFSTIVIGEGGVQSAQLYMGSYGGALLLFGVLFFMGLHAERETMPSLNRTNGLRRGITLTAIGAVLIAGAVAFPYLHRREVTILMACLALFSLTFSRLSTRWFERKSGQLADPAGERV